MLALVPSRKFRSDVRRTKKQGKDLSKLQALIESLQRQEPLPEKHKDHSLKGNWKDYREVHIEPDWLLVYRIEGNELYLARTGSHSSLFK